MYSSLSKRGITTIFDMVELSLGFFQLVNVTGEPHDAITKAATTAKRLK